MANKPLYRIGELAKLAEISPRTIDFYTSMGLIEPERRSAKNYRLYSDETLLRLKRIVQLKKDKYSLDEIRENLNHWGKVSSEEQVSSKLTDLQMQLERLQREVQELEPVINQLKPKQAQLLFKRIVPQSAACVEALMLLMNKSGLM
ncbi:MerR family transcriptional regulator [Paenibacillus oenotherae]|uniref:MerR family transcriptional regulator n=1 Tax=Paenibacillus oenotherae TaxID=1435645 RepID=A0ABS7DDJ3_9BACL|nr:MerR family transcriptional regulator [Paenibacillus oenotherae]MBW7477726.1 MerR family transcriptional regulator [Paenibacillus oenotherae]